MFLVRRVRKELLAYQALRLRQYEVKRKLDDLERHVRVRTSYSDDMPKLKGGISKSSVEQEVLWREEKRSDLQQELREIEDKLKPMKRSLRALLPLERQVIKYTHLNYSLDEQQLAEKLGITKGELQKINDSALYSLYGLLLREHQRNISG